MAKIFYILFVLSLPYFAPSVLSQPALIWAKDLNTHLDNGSAKPSQHVVDNDGNIYTSGYFSGTHDFDPGPGVFELSSTGTPNIFILKLDSAGNFLWVAGIGGGEQVIGNYVLGNPIATDQSGNIYVTGFFKGTTDFDPGPGAYNLTSTGGRSDVFVLKLDSNGIFVFARNIGSGLFGLFGTVSGAIAIANSEAIYITGGFSNTVDFDGGPNTQPLTAVGFVDVFVLKLDLDGNFLWAKQFGGTDSQNFGYSVALSPFGDLYLCGYFTNKVDFDPNAGVFNLQGPNGQYNTYICKLSKDGNLIWAKNLGGEKSIFGYSLALNANEEVLVAGEFQQTIDFDPGPGSYNLSGGGTYILKLSKTGNFIWAKNLPATSYNDASGIMTLDTKGNVYLIGSFTGQRDFDPGTNSYLLNSIGYNPAASSNFSDIFVLSLSMEGDFRWARSIGSVGEDNGTSISVSDDQYIHFAGGYSKEMDIDPGQDIYVLPPHNFSLSSSDVFIAKWGQLNSFIGIIPPVSATIAPNPVKETLVIRLGVPTSNINVALYTTNGMLVFEKYYEKATDITLDLNILRGVYLLHIRNDHRSLGVFKCIKE